MRILDTAEGQQERPPDRGLAQLPGIGAESAERLGATRLVAGVDAYDETVTSERIIAVADLYYIYQHERHRRVPRRSSKLQELFKAGTVRLSSGQGAYGALPVRPARGAALHAPGPRCRLPARASATAAHAVPRGARPNTDFHPLFTHFINQVALFWRDKRISDVIRERALRPELRLDRRGPPRRASTCATT